MKKFDWLASESGPEGYPMEIVSGNYYYLGEGSLYIPNGKTLHNGWGEGLSTHVVGPELKPLPERVEITFFSYTEDKFYHGDFELPYKRILELFTEGFYSLKTTQDITYKYITTGVSPGGLVNVWIAGFDKRYLIFSGQAKEADVPWERIIDNPDYTRELFIKEELEESLKAEELEKVIDKSIPIDRWYRFNNRYHWQPRIITESRPPKIIYLIKYANGEKDYLQFPFSLSEDAPARAVPSEIYYPWIDPQGNAKNHIFGFDKLELVEAFEKLHTIKPATITSPIYLNIELIESSEGRSVGISLQHEDEVIPITHTKMKQYTSNFSLDDEDYFYQD